jgi:hypothetical protein
MLRRSGFVVVALVASFLWLLGCPGIAAAGTASEARLYLSPQTGAYKVGTEFDVQIRLDLRAPNANVVQADIAYSDSTLDCLRVTPGPSFDISFEPSAARCNEDDGTFEFVAGKTGPGLTTGDYLVGTVRFRAGPTKGAAPVSYAPSSAVAGNGELLALEMSGAQFAAK